jgi:RNA polymerase sigma factor (TIGR02999 family)
MIVESADVTRLLLARRDGDRAALDELPPLVNDELRRLARRYLRRESPGHTLESLALLNEAYLRLIDQRSVDWQNRAHFFGVAAQLMRRILIDHARTDAERLRRFGLADEAASALNHPHVATIYEIGEADGVSFIAMEYVEGQKGGRAAV